MLVVLARHGQSTSNVGGALVGRSDPPLSERGREQALALARRLAGFGLSEVVTSPSERAQSTAQAIAASSSCPLRVDERWQEMDYGLWEGRRVGELRPDRGGFFDSSLFRPPGGESMEEMGERVRSGLADLATADGTVCVVSHMGPVKWVVLDVLGAGVAAFRRFRVDEASVSLVVTLDDDWFVRSVNDTSHLGGL